LISFVKRVAIENEDAVVLTNVSTAISYLENFCPNLTLKQEDKVMTVADCKTCPFLNYHENSQYLGGGEYVCALIERLNIEWKDKDGFDDMFRDGRMPSVCPLRYGDITIKLN
jgi:hypothetical protein